MNNKLSIVSLIVVIANNPVFAETFPINGYMKANTIYDNAATYANMGVYSGTVSAKAEYEDVVYNCATGYYLPASSEACVQCLTNHTCSGGVFTYSPNTDQGIENLINTIIVEAGYYLPKQSTEQAICPENNYCEGGEFEYSDEETQGLSECDTNLKSPEGSKSESSCGYKFHIGDNDYLYLSKEKITSPSFNIQVGNTAYYGQMTQTPTTINTNSSKKLLIKVGDKTYYVHDETVN